jgi:tetratricopeptide (TPR) repeat protein
MAEKARALTGYVKTANLYLFVLISLSVGFLGGVIFSSYKTSSIMISQSETNATDPVPMNQERREKLAALIKATETTPDKAQVWGQLASFYFDINAYEKSIQAYKKALELDDGIPDIWVDMGVMYRRSGDPTQAIQSFDQALTINNHHEPALFNKGIVLMYDLKDTQGALEAWEKLVQINPKAQTPTGQTVKSLIDDIKQKHSS